MSQKSLVSETSSTPAVPIEFAGKWIAWNATETHIIASGQSFDEALDAALAAGERDPVLTKVPRVDVRFVGGRRVG